MNEPLIWVLIYFVLFGAIGMLIGQRKGRVIAGLIWAMLLGPFGWLLVALGPNMGQGKSANCPLCGKTVPVNQPECLHCRNPLRWMKGKPLVPSKLVRD